MGGKGTKRAGCSLGRAAPHLFTSPVLPCWSPQFPSRADHHASAHTSNHSPARDRPVQECHPNSRDVATHFSTSGTSLTMAALGSSQEMAMTFQSSSPGACMVWWASCGTKVMAHPCLPALLALRGSSQRWPF